MQAVKQGHCSWFIVFLLLFGCGDGGAKQKLNAYEAFAAGMEAYQNKDYAKAGELFGTAIEAGGLNADDYCDAALKRAIALAHEGDFDTALEELTRLAEGAPDMASVHAARAFIYQKQGNTAAAQQESAEARRMNPLVQPIQP